VWGLVLGPRLKGLAIPGIGLLSHGTLSLGSAPMSLLLDDGTKMVQGPSPVRVAEFPPVLSCSN
jgi:hypothetical protein